MNRALIIKQPWIDKILNKSKTWEMRSRITKVRGKIGLIESGTGLIVGEANLVNCICEPIGELGWGLDFHQIKDNSLLEKYPYAWVLDNAKRYKQPIPYKHPKGAVVWVKLNAKAMLGIDPKGEE